MKFYYNIYQLDLLTKKTFTNLPAGSFANGNFAGQGIAPFAQQGL